MKTDHPSLYRPSATGEEVLSLHIAPGQWMKPRVRRRSWWPHPELAEELQAVCTLPVDIWKSRIWMHDVVALPQALPILLAALCLLLGALHPAEGGVRRKAGHGDQFLLELVSWISVLELRKAVARPRLPRWALRLRQATPPALWAAWISAQFTSKRSATKDFFRRASRSILIVFCS